MTLKTLEDLDRKQAIKKLEEMMEENELSPSMTQKQIEQYKYAVHMCTYDNNVLIALTGRRERARKRWKNSIPR